MTKTLKRILIFVLILQITLISCSCGKKETSDVEFVNPFEGYSYDEFISEASAVENKTEYTTGVENTFKINSVKIKKTILSVSSVILSIVTTVVAFIFGGVYTIPGWRSAPSDHKSIVVKVTYKNNLGQDVMLGDVVHHVFAEVDGEIYDGFYCYQYYKGIDDSPTTVIKDGTSKTLSLVVDIPTEKINDHENFVVYFDIDGESHSYQYIK